MTAKHHHLERRSGAIAQRRARPHGGGGDRRQDLCGRRPRHHAAEPRRRSRHLRSEDRTPGASGPPLPTRALRARVGRLSRACIVALGGELAPNTFAENEAFDPETRDVAHAEARCCTAATAPRRRRPATSSMSRRAQAEAGSGEPTDQLVASGFTEITPTVKISRTGRATKAGRGAARQLHRVRQGAAGRTGRNIDKQEPTFVGSTRRATRRSISKSRFYLLGTDYPGSPNIPVDLAKLPISRPRWAARPGVAQRFNHLEVESVKGSLRPHAVYQSIRYSLDGSTTFSNHDRDITQYGGTARVSYEMHRRASSRSSSSTPTSPRPRRRRSTATASSAIPAPPRPRSAPPSSITASSPARCRSATSSAPTRTPNLAPLQG